MICGFKHEVRKHAHCEPLVLGPAFAMDTVKGLSWRRLRLNSSSNSPPQMLWPPVPSPARKTLLLSYRTKKANPGQAETNAMGLCAIAWEELT